jgi:phosphate transport system protein
VREEFHEQLTALWDQLASLCGRATEAMRQATQALANTDVALADQVIGADAELNAQRSTCDEHAQSLLALQAPVASDLRTILAVLYCAAKLERMGDLAAHIADIVRFSHPEPAVPAEWRYTVTTLGELTVGMAEDLHALITGAATDGSAKINTTDDAVDALCARLMATITSTDWSHGVYSATNLALLGRFYERYGDQAVSVARRLEFAATGTLHQE